MSIYKKQVEVSFTDSSKRSTFQRAARGLFLSRATSCQLCHEQWNGQLYIRSNELSTLPGAMKWSTLHQEQRAVNFARSNEMVNFTSGATSCQLCQEQGNGQLYIRSNELSALPGAMKGQLYLKQQVICDHLSQGQLELILTEHTQR